MHYTGRIRAPVNPVEHASIYRDVKAEGTGEGKTHPSPDDYFKRSSDGGFYDLFLRQCL